MDDSRFLRRDQRRNTRVDINIDMHLVVFDANSVGLINGGETIKLRSGMITDLSASGLKVETGDLQEQWHFHLLSGGILLAVKFVLPGHKEPVSAVAKVVWAKEVAAQLGVKYTFGLTFTEVSPADKNTIDQFIKNAAKITKPDQKS